MKDGGLKDGEEREGWRRGGGRGGGAKDGETGEEEDEGNEKEEVKGRRRRREGKVREKDELAENVAENIPSFDHLVIVNFKVFRQISISPIYSNLLVVMVVTVSQEFLEF